MKLYNSLTRKIEEFKPINPPKVGMYTCGPTVYSYATIGNFRTYTLADVLLRTLKANGFEVAYIMNITDVGHLTGDNAGDADTGEDRIERAAAKEGKTAWNIAQFYTDAFLADFAKLHLTEPLVFSKATDHIQEQIELIKQIEEKGFTYRISDGIYFDTVAFEKQTGKHYGQLSTLTEIKEGARVEVNPEKKDSRDFALWKFSDTPGKRHMEWDSPWGLGFPGWHIECSAMSMKYLGQTFDIHGGGEDLRSTHHPNEIAQSEAVTGKQFVKYWVHGAFMTVEGKRMAKSLGNAYTVSDIEKKGFAPVALRYLYLTIHYRQIMNFTWESLKAAQTAYDKLVKMMSDSVELRSTLSDEKFSRRAGSGSTSQLIEKFKDEFFTSMNNDLGTPNALAVVWEMIKSNIPLQDKSDLLLEFNEVLGLGLRAKSEKLRVPEEVEELLSEREELRRKKMWEEADKLKERIESRGYMVMDTEKGPRLKVQKGF